MSDADAWNELIEAEARQARYRLATHIHLKSGGLYIKLREATWEKTMEPVVIYEAAESGRVFVRVKSEFDDHKRFALLTKD